MGVLRLMAYLQKNLLRNFGINFLMLIFILLETPVYQLDLDPVRLSLYSRCDLRAENTHVLCVPGTRRMGLCVSVERSGCLCGWQPVCLSSLHPCSVSLSAGMTPGVAALRSGWLLRALAYPFHIRVYYSLD